MIDDDNVVVQGKSSLRLLSRNLRRVSMLFVVVDCDIVCRSEISSQTLSNLGTLYDSE